MIRKVIIVVLTLAAVGTGVLWFAGCTVHGQEFRQFDLGAGISHVIQCGTTAYHFVATKGTLAFQVSRRADAVKAGPLRAYSFAGFSVESYSRAVPPWGPSSNWLIRLPLWALFTLFAAYPSIAFIRGPLRRWRRGKRGSCLKCGYDLTGNVSGVCSECGTKVDVP